MKKNLLHVAALLVPLVFVRGIWGEDRRIVRLRLGTLQPLFRGPAGVRVWLGDKAVTVSRRSPSPLRSTPPA